MTRKPTEPGKRRIPTWLIGAASLLVLGIAVGLFVVSSADSTRPKKSDSPKESSVSSELITPTKTDTTGSTGDKATGSHTGKTALPGASDSSDKSAEAAPPSWRTLSGLRFGLDAGHAGGNEAHTAEISQLVPAGKGRKACDAVGASTDAGYPEHAFTFDVALRMQSLLEAAGATVFMTRTDDTSWGPCVNRRAAITNQADVAISIHADGDLKAGSHGFHVIQPIWGAKLTDDIYAPSQELARMMRGAILAGTPLHISNYRGKDGVDTRGDLAGLMLSDVPKVFVELGNMHDAQDAKLQSTPAGRDLIARALVDGLAAWAAAHPTQ